MSEEKKQKSTEEHIHDYMKELVTALEAQQPYREHIIAMKKEYADNGWLSREQQSLLIKAYRAVQKNMDIDDFNEAFELVKRQFPNG